MSVACSGCGAANDIGRRFCSQCGRPLGLPCQACGGSNPPEARFCGDCGSPLASRDGPPAARADASDAGTRPESRERTERTERRLVSVLFADLVGFTGLAEQRDIEAVRDLLSAYADLARDTVERHGGSVEKYIGDAVMAVWGTPVTREDDAERAVRAALELVAAVGGLGPELVARAAVMTGEAAAVVGATDQAMVTGDLVNAAARLQALAAPGTVLCDATTRQAAFAAISFEPAGDRVLRGREAPVAAHRALRVVARRGGRGRSEGLEPPFVGRDADLALLKDLFHATARDGRARLVAVLGQAGIGKSRLAWELLKYLDGVVTPVWWHEGRSPAYGDGITFWALGEMVRRRAGLVESDDELATSERIALTVAEYVPDPDERAWIESALLTLLGATPAEPGGDAELFAAWRTFFERIADRGPVVLAFEDLQWGDDGLLDFVDHLLEWSPGRPILVLALARPELLDRRPGWARGLRNFTSIRLDGIADEDMRRLVEGTVPGLPATAVEAVVERAGGVPLYAVEIVRMLLAEGRLTADGGAYRPVGELGDLPLPPTLRALIAARLDALPPTEREVVLDASVLGQSFTLDGLAAVSRQPREALEGLLTAVARQEIVTRVRDVQSPERGQWRFVQGLAREVAYGTLARRERLARHLAAARHLEAVGGDEIAAAVAVHHVAAFRAAEGGPEAEALGSQARVALRAAAGRAASLGSHVQAISMIDEALALTDRPEERADLLDRGAESASAAARHDDAIARRREALELRRRDGNSSDVTRATTGLATALVEAFRIDEAITILEPAAAGFEPDGSDAAEVALAAQLARAFYLRSDGESALAWIERVLPAAERLELDEIIADVLITRGTILANHDRPREGVIVLEGARRLAEESGRSSTVLRALHNLSAVTGRRDPQACYGYARTGLDLAVRLGRRNQAAHLLINASGSAVRTGEWEWATARMDEMLATDFDPEDRARLLAARLVLRLFRGEPYVAEIDEVVRVLGAIDDPQTAAQVQWLKATAAFVEDRYPDAFDLAIALAGPPIEDPETWPAAGHAALWAGDRIRLATAIEGLATLRTRGPILELDLRCLRLGLDALGGGQASAAAAIEAAIGAWRDAGLPWDAALYGLALARAIGLDRPEAARAASEARATFTELRAAPFLARADTLLRAAPGTPASEAEPARAR